MCFFSPSDRRRSSNVFKCITLLKVKWSFPLALEGPLQHVSGFVYVEMDKICRVTQEEILASLAANHTKEMDVVDRFRGNELNPVSKYRRRDRHNQGSDRMTKHLRLSCHS